MQINISNRDATILGAGLLTVAVELARPGTLMSVVAWVQSLAMVIA